MKLLDFSICNTSSPRKYGGVSIDSSPKPRADFNDARPPATTGRTVPGSTYATWAQAGLTADQ